MSPQDFSACECLSLAWNPQQLPSAQGSFPHNSLPTLTGGGFNCSRTLPTHKAFVSHLYFLKCFFFPWYLARHNSSNNLENKNKYKNPRIFIWIGLQNIYLASPYISLFFTFHPCSRPSGLSSYREQCTLLYQRLGAFLACDYCYFRYLFICLYNCSSDICIS